MQVEGFLIKIKLLIFIYELETKNSLLLSHCIREKL